LRGSDAHHHVDSGRLEMVKKTGAALSSRAGCPTMCD